MVMARRQVLVQLTDELVTLLDRRAAQSGKSRSEVIRAAIEHHLDTGRRPFLILTRERAIPVLQRLIVVPATRTVRGIPSEVALSEEDGMPEPCVISFDNVTTVPKALPTERI